MHIARRRAVSIVELLIVVVILLIFSTLTIISYHNMTRGLVARSQANEFVAVFVLSRELAITGGTTHQVVIDQGARAFWIDRLDALGAIDLPKVSGVENYLPETRVPQITVNGSVIPPGGQAVINFRPDGPSDSATLQIIRQGADVSDASEYFSIVLYPPTANARIYPNEQR